MRFSNRSNLLQRFSKASSIASSSGKDALCTAQANAQVVSCDLASVSSTSPVSLLRSSSGIPRQGFPLRIACRRRGTSTHGAPWGMPQSPVSQVCRISSVPGARRRQLLREPGALGLHPQQCRNRPSIGGTCCPPHQARKRPSGEGCPSTDRALAALPTAIELSPVSRESQVTFC